MFTTRTERERLEAEEAPARPQPAPSLDAGLTPTTVLALQRAGAGNQAIARTLARSQKGGTGNMFAALGQQKPQPTKPPKKADTAKSQGQTQTRRNDPPLQRAIQEPPKTFLQTQVQAKPKTPIPTIPAAAVPPNLAADRQALIDGAKGWLPHLDYALIRAPDIDANSKLRTKTTAVREFLASKAAPLKGWHDVQKAVDVLTDHYQLAGTLIELCEPVPAGATPGANPADALLEVAKRNIRLRMATEPWANAARGGNLDFEADPDDTVFRQKLVDEFHNKKIDRTQWTDRKPRETAYYYVTRSSNSGAAYDITAHSFPEGRTPTETDRGTTVHVLHIPKKRK